MALHEETYSSSKIHQVRRDNSKHPTASALNCEFHVCLSCPGDSCNWWDNHMLLQLSGRMTTCRYQTTSSASPSKAQTSSTTPYVLPGGPHGELLLRLIRTLPQQLLRSGSGSSAQETPQGRGPCRCLYILHSSMQIAMMMLIIQVCFSIISICCMLMCFMPCDLVHQHLALEPYGH